MLLLLWPHNYGGTPPTTEAGPDLYVLYDAWRKRHKKKEEEPKPHEVEEVEELVEELIAEEATKPEDVYFDYSPQLTAYLDVALKLAEAEAKLKELLAAQMQEDLQRQAATLRAIQLEKARQILLMIEEEEMVQLLLLN